MKRKKICLAVIIMVLGLALSSCGKTEGTSTDLKENNSPPGDTQTAANEKTDSENAAPETEDESHNADDRSQNAEEANQSSEGTSQITDGANQNTDEARLTGKLKLINLDDRNPSILRGLRIMGTSAGSVEDINGKASSLDDIRCIFELTEWVEFYPDTDAEYSLRVWVLKHRIDQEYYNDCKFSDLMPNFATYCDLHYPEDADNPEEWYWGNFYLNPEECEPGYYDFVFTYDGKAIATLLTRFYMEGELREKSGSELEALVDNERIAAGGSAEGNSDDNTSSGDNTGSVENSGIASGENTGSGAGNGNSSGDSSSVYTFPGYTTEGIWPDANAWAGMGLPELPAQDAGKVSVSTKTYIYPLNAKDGVMFECRPESSHFEEIVAALESAGISGEDLSDSFDKKYTADYTLGSDPMRVTVTEYDTGKLVVFVQYMPE